VKLLAIAILAALVWALYRVGNRPPATYSIGDITAAPQLATAIAGAEAVDVLQGFGTKSGGASSGLTVGGKPVSGTVYAESKGWSPADVGTRNGKPGSYLAP
jgi:hypothetical protein